LQKSEDHNRNLALEVRFPNYQIHYGAIYHSKLLPTQEITRVLQTTNLSTYSTLVNQSSTTLVLATKQIAQLLQDPTEQQQALDLEIKKLEKETGKSFTEEQKELIKKFTNASQEATKDKDNEEAKNDVEELEDELKKELKKTNFSREDVKKVIHHCERLIELVQQTKENQFEAQVEIPAK
jgi:molecular chaperone DnaK (HSP70)